MYPSEVLPALPPTSPATCTSAATTVPFSSWTVTDYSGVFAVGAGNGYAGDGGPARFISSLAVDVDGTVCVADVGNNAIRLLKPLVESR